MKRKTYLCIVLCITTIILFHWSCTDSDFFKSEMSHPQNIDFSIEEAKAFFEKQIGRYAVATRSLQERSDRRTITPGEFTPSWGKAIVSVQANLACYDIPIETSYRYKAISTNYNNGKATARIVNAYQKLIIVKDIKTNNLGQYILTLIPDKNYENKYENQVCEQFINCADKGGFSGVAIYTVPQLNLMIRVNRYVDGVKKAGVFLSGSQEQMHQKIAFAQSITKGVYLKRQVKKVSTRSFGEDNYWEDDNFLGETDDVWASTSWMNDWILNGGMIIPADGGWIFIGENGDWFAVMDDNKDGEPDTVVITPNPPEDSGSSDDSTILPDPDPTGPDDTFGNACPFCGSTGCAGDCMTPIPPSTGPDTPPESQITSKSLFRNSSMIEQNWKKIDQMIEKIIEDCMGDALVNGLYKMLNGKTLIIRIGSGENGGFGLSKGITLGEQMESNQLFHEMMHAYQAYHLANGDEFNDRALNLEIEAHYAQYLYLKKLEEYPGSKWEDRYSDNPRYKAIAGLEYHINNKGGLIGNTSNLNGYLGDKVIRSFRATKGYENFPYDNFRNTIDTFNNLKSLTINCN